MDSYRILAGLYADNHISDIAVMDILEQYGLLVFTFYMLRAFVALFWGFFLLFYRKRTLRRQNIGFACIFIIVGLLYTFNSFRRMPQIATVDTYNVRSCLIIILMAPFALTFGDFSTNKIKPYRKYLPHFLPFILLLAVYFLLRRFYPHIPPCYDINEILGYRHDYPLYVIYYLLLILTFVSQVLGYIFISTVDLLKIRHLHRKHRLSMKNVNGTAVVYLMFLWYTLYGVVFMAYNNSSVLGVTHHVSISICITVVSVLCMQLRLPLRTAFVAKRSDILQSHSSDGELSSADAGLLKQIQKLFEEKRIFCKPDISLMEVAQKCASNRTYVSACINRHYGCNFRQFLLRHRLLAAQQMMQQKPDCDIRQIAREAGFNSYAALSNAFSKHISKDLTPEEWRRQILSAANNEDTD
jgi:AraC-like DNA-binding protein